MTSLAVFVCTFGYIGYCPFAPGTVGSAAGVAVFLLLRWLHEPYAAAAAIAALFVAGVWSGTVAERHFGRSDPAQGVIDEVVGMLITLYGVDVGWVGLGVAFVLFRLSDVIKPFPAGRFERLHGGLGMMADDAMAAVYANVVLRLMVWGLPGLSA